VRQYVYNNGASHEPTLAEMQGAIPGGVSVTDWNVQSYKGYIADNAHEQYAQKMYSVRIVADQAVTIPIQIFWTEQLTVITSTGGVDTTEYTTGTDDNVVERLTVSLALGVNDLHIITYTGIADQRLELTLDMTSIHQSWTPATKFDAEASAITAQVHIDEPDGLGTQVCKLLYVHSDYAPNGINLITCRVETGESSSYSVDFEIWDDPLEGSPTAIATVATSSSTEAETSTLTNSSVDAGQYVMGSLPATDVNWVGMEITFTKA